MYTITSICSTIIVLDTVNVCTQWNSFIFIENLLEKSQIEIH